MSMGIVTKHMGSVDFFTNKRLAETSIGRVL